MNKWRHVYQNENNNNNKEWIGWINFWNIQHIQHTHTLKTMWWWTYISMMMMKHRSWALSIVFFSYVLFSLFFFIYSKYCCFFLVRTVFFRFITKLISLVLRWSLSIFFRLFRSLYQSDVILCFPTASQIL